MSDVNSLLIKIFEITNKYEKIAKLTGMDFNIFSVLRISENEISHSRIIANLLNPTGRHGQGDFFLRHFLDVIKKELNGDVRSKILNEKLDDLINREVNVELEKDIGLIKEQYTIGGRIDICISEKNKPKIMIENKINAEDQKNQLLRYYNYSKDALLLYLTLDGREADAYSMGDSNSKVEYFQISYKTTILEWLERCKSGIAEKPFIRETLLQYIIVIKKLTDSTWSKPMATEIIETIIQNEDNLKAAKEVVNNFENLKLTLMNEFIKRFIQFFHNKELEKNIKLINYFENNNSLKTDSNVELLSIKIQSKVNLELLFAIRKEYGLIFGLTSGLCKEIENKSPVYNYLRDGLPEFDQGSTKNFICWKKLNIHFNKLEEETIRSINLNKIDETIQNIFVEAEKTLKNISCLE